MYYATTNSPCFPAARTVTLPTPRGSLQRSAMLDVVLHNAGRNHRTPTKKKMQMGAGARLALLLLHLVPPIAGVASPAADSAWRSRHDVSHDGGAGFDRWFGACGANWNGPNPLAHVNNSALDCELKDLAVRFGLKAIDGGAARAELVRSRLANALNVAACNGSVPTAAAPRLQEADAAGAGVGAAGAAGAAAAVSAAVSAMARRAGCSMAQVTQIHVSTSSGSDATGDGSGAKPFRTIARGLADVAAVLPAQRPGPVVVWLREGVYHEQVAVNAAHSGASANSHVAVAAFPGERVVISGGVPLSGLAWEPTTIAGRSVDAFKAPLQAPLPAAASGGSFTGLFGSGQRLTRARYPNCADITGPFCFTLNSSTAIPGGPGFPMDSVLDVPGGVNLEVRNQHGVDMFAASTDNTHATGPKGASDGTLANGTNATVVVAHPDYAWRAHGDATFGSGFSTWQSYVAAGGTDAPGRFDDTFNEPFWHTDVSRGFYFNASAPATPLAPAWTPRRWATPATGVVHMYHSDSWGGWSFQLAARNDTDSSLSFACTVAGSKQLRPCSRDGTPANVQGGWQEARGGPIKAGNGFFVENIKEELDFPGEWFYDAAEGPHGTLYLIPPAGGGEAAGGPPSPELELIATVQKRVVTVLGDARRPVSHFTLANVTIAHSAATYLDPFEVPSGGDWAIHRGGAVFVDRAVDVGVSGCTFDQVDGSGVMLSRHVRNSSVSANSFFAVGETAILLVGASAKHRINMGGSDEYPAFNAIERNLVDTVGVWVKQSAAYFKSLARQNVLRRNVFFGGPRSGINFNDGAMGGETMEGNLLLNFVRESNDHGPFNSWDRQPYIYRVNESDPRTDPMPDGTPRLASIIDRTPSPDTVKNVA